MITQLEKTHYKAATPQVQSGDTVRVHQRIREGSKQRIQVFEGVVIRTHRMGSVSATMTVRRIASGVGVEKTYLLHSPNVDRVEILRRAKVRRNFLGYLRDRRGKSARLQEIGFDKAAANAGTINAHHDNEDEHAADPDLEIDGDQNQDELNEVEVSTDQVANDENREAAVDDPSSADGGTDAGDEQELPREEAESKIDKPDSNK